MSLKSLITTPWNVGRRDEDIFQDLHTAVDKVFNDFRTTPLGWPRDSGIGVFNPLYDHPKTDVSEVDDKVEIEVELPGVDLKDVDVTLDGQILVIKGHHETEKTAEKKNYRSVERSRGSFRRAIPLGFDADPGSVDALFDKGVLKVSVAKPEEVVAKIKKIEVKESNAA